MHLTFFYVLCESESCFQQVWQKLDPSSRFLRSCHYLYMSVDSQGWFVRGFEQDLHETAAMESW